MQSERQLLDPAGLPRREWYRHLLYAPGLYTGYDVKTLPGVREGIEQQQYEEAEAEIARAAKALERETALVDAAAVELRRLGPPPGDWRVKGGRVGADAAARPASRSLLRLGVVGGAVPVHEDRGLVAHDPAVVPGRQLRHRAGTDLRLMAVAHPDAEPA